MWVQILLIFIEHYSQMCPLYIPDPRFEHRPFIVRLQWPQNPNKGEAFVWSRQPHFPKYKPQHMIKKIEEDFALEFAEVC